MCACSHVPGLRLSNNQTGTPCRLESVVKRMLGLLDCCCVVIPAGQTEAKVRFDVQKLDEMCKGEDPTYCIAYIAGVTDMMGMAAAVGNNTKELGGRRIMGICPVTFLSYGSARQAFLNWADKHPEKWSEEMGFGVIEALRDTWPCKSRENLRWLCTFLLRVGHTGYVLVSNNLVVDCIYCKPNEHP